jgi:glycosyltransferase involved in cell wall biosynthesis
MNIAIASPITIYKFLDYLDKESNDKAAKLDGLKAPAVDSLILGLLKNGHNLSIYTLGETKEIVRLNGKQLSIFIAPVINTKWWRPLGIFTYKANQIRKCINLDKTAIDIIHAHWTYEYAIGALYSKKNVPVVVTVRDWAPAVLKLFKYNYYFYVRYILDYIVFNHKKVKFIANSEYIAQKIKKKWKVDAIVIPNPVDDNFLSSPKEEKKQKFTIISITNKLCKLKNIDNLIYAFQQFRLKYENVELFLVGSDFTDANFFINKWRQKGLLEDVKLLGNIQHDELIKILDQSDLLVHPSLEESFGNIFIEAMARKVPTLGGLKSGAVPYILLNGETGYLCDVKSVFSIKESIEFLYLNPLYRKKLAEKAYIYLLNNYTSSIIVTLTLKQYNKLLDSK